MLFIFFVDKKYVPDLVDENNEEQVYEIESKAISIGNKTTIYNKDHNIVPKTIKKEIRDLIKNTDESKEEKRTIR